MTVGHNRRVYMENSGMTALEAVIAMTLLATAMSLLLPLIRQYQSRQLSAENTYLAISELENLMEEVSGAQPATLTQERLSQLLQIDPRISQQLRRPSVRVTVTKADTDVCVQVGIVPQDAHDITFAPVWLTHWRSFDPKTKVGNKQYSEQPSSVANDVRSGDTR